MQWLFLQSEASNEENLFSKIRFCNIIYVLPPNCGEGSGGWIYPPEQGKGIGSFPMSSPTQFNLSTALLINAVRPLVHLNSHVFHTKE